MNVNNLKYLLEQLEEAKFKKGVPSRNAYDFKIAKTNEYYILSTKHLSNLNYFEGMEYEVEEIKASFQDEDNTILFLPLENERAKEIFNRKKGAK